MSDLTWRSIQRSLPFELQLEIAEEIIFNTCAFLFFDVDVDADPSRPRSRAERYENLPRKTRRRFWPVVNSPTYRYNQVSWPNAYESHISKIIRKLMDPRLGLRSSLCKQFAKRNGIITVPNGTVYFNPEKHVICIRNVNFIRNRRMPWTRLDFDINHLACMGGSHLALSPIQSAFPMVQRMYGVYPAPAMRNFSKPSDIIGPSNEKRSLSVESIYVLTTWDES